MADDREKQELAALRAQVPHRYHELAQFLIENANRLHQQSTMFVGRAIHHLEEVITTALAKATAEILAAIAASQAPTTRPAVGLTVSIGGPRMANVTMSVDVAGEKVTAHYVDRLGEPTTDVPANIDRLAYTSSDPAVVTVDEASGALTFNRAGDAVLTADSLDSSGAKVPGFEKGINLTLTPGTATGLDVSVEGAEPVPAPNPGPDGHGLDSPPPFRMRRRLAQQHPP